MLNRKTVTNTISWSSNERPMCLFVFFWLNLVPVLHSFGSVKKNCLDCLQTVFPCFFNEFEDHNRPMSLSHSWTAKYFPNLKKKGEWTLYNWLLNLLYEVIYYMFDIKNQQLKSTSSMITQYCPVGISWSHKRTLCRDRQTPTLHQSTPTRSAKPEQRRK